MNLGSLPAPELDLAAIAAQAGDDTEIVEVSRRWLKQVARELQDGRVALAQLAARDAVDRVIASLLNPKGSLQ